MRIDVFVRNSAGDLERVLAGVDPTVENRIEVRRTVREILVAPTTSALHGDRFTPPTAQDTINRSVSDRLAYVRSGLDDVEEWLDDLTRCGNCSACHEEGDCVDRLDLRSLAVKVEALRRDLDNVSNSLRSAVVEFSCSTVPRPPVNGERLDLWLVEQVAQMRAMHAAEVATMRTEFEARLATVERLTGVRFGK